MQRFSPKQGPAQLWLLGGAEPVAVQIRWWEKAPGWLQDTAKEVRALSLHGLRLAHRLWVDPSTKDTSISTQKDDAFG